jgi:hypothetical protein
MKPVVMMAVMSEPAREDSPEESVAPVGCFLDDSPVRKGTWSGRSVAW